MGLAKEIGATCRVSEFVWTGDNTHAARILAAGRLAQKLERLRQRYPQEPIFLVGHSHGGNLALSAVNRCAVGTVQRLVLLANPHMAIDRGRSQRRSAAHDVETVGIEDETDTEVQWLYWGLAALRIPGGIWNVYSRQDSVQAGLSALSSGLSKEERRAFGGRVRVFQEYTGIGQDRVRNGAVNWQPSSLFSPGHGVRVHSAMHSEQMGHLVGCLIAHDIAFENATVASGLSLEANEIKDTGAGVWSSSARAAVASVSRRCPSALDYERPPYRVNLDPDGPASVGVLLVHGLQLRQQR